MRRKTNCYPLFKDPEAIYAGSSCFDVMFLYTVKQQSSHANIFSACDALERSKEELSYITEILYEDKSKT
jgi:hypothetical protein